MRLRPMGLFRPWDARQRLPMYEPGHPPTPIKERYSDSETSTDDDSNDDDDDDDGVDAEDSNGFYVSSVASPRLGSGQSSRHSSGSAMTSSLMLPKRAVAATAAAKQHSRLPRQRQRLGGIGAQLYRLPNKVVRYLCAAMIFTILLFIFSLVRASRLENRRIASGQFDRPTAPPPIWESFDFLTRYYGGVRNLVSLKDNVAQYPREEDEQPYNVTSTPDDIAAGDAPEPPRAHLHAASSFSVNNNKGPLPPSFAFEQHEGFVLAGGSGDISLVECFIDRNNYVRIPSLRYFDGRPNGFPRNVLGSYELLSLPEDICFERYGRFGPYGYGYSVRSGGLGTGEYGEKAGSEAVWESTKPVDYTAVDWAEVQKRCYDVNAHRFQTPSARPIPPKGFYIGEELSAVNTNVQSFARDKSSQDNETLAAPDFPAAPAAPAPPVIPAVPISPAVPAAPVVPAVPASTPADKQPSAASPHSNNTRTAVVVRCWDEFVWREEDIMNLRALIVELSLASGSRYDVHLLVQVKNDAKHPIWADDEIYQQRVNATVPAEFRGLVTLWTETQMLALYQGMHDHFIRGPDLPVHGVYRGLQMAMQHFAQLHPEYEYFWQWEMDIRYTGHNLDLFTKMENWAAKQPRKGLWERNARFYMPDVHGSWDDFRQMARVQSEAAAAGADKAWNGGRGKEKDSKDSDTIVWGPVRPADPKDWFEADSDPIPPTSYEKDRYTWGVDEEADLITLSPIFDPAGTTWLLADDITGYNETAEGGKPPRRAQIITASRMSRRLLWTMHRETALMKHHAFSEMWPATVALQHGYKAVYVPHPVYVDREWPTAYMARIFNGGRNGATGGSRTSVFGQREHNLLGLTWYYNAGFSRNLYRRWLGLKVNNDGGQAFEEETDGNEDGSTVKTMRGGEGRMCMPPMLLHPIKDVELPVESKVGEEYEKKPSTESDPSS